MSPEGDLGPSNLEPRSVLGTQRGITSGDVVDDGLRVGVLLTARGAIEYPASLHHPMNVELEGVIRGPEMKPVRVGVASTQGRAKTIDATLGVGEDVMNQRPDLSLSITREPSSIGPVVEPCIQSIVAFLEGGDLTRDVLEFRRSGGCDRAGGSRSEERHEKDDAEGVHDDPFRGHRGLVSGCCVAERVPKRMTGRVPVRESPGRVMRKPADSSKSAGRTVRVAGDRPIGMVSDCRCSD